MRDALSRAGIGSALDPHMWQRRWTVHVEHIGNGRHATLYLSNYVYRVALTNERLERLSAGQVTFQYTHARTHTTRSLTLPVDGFLTRFLQHVLPRGFTKVRWYGLLSPSRRADLDRARHLLAHRDQRDQRDQPSEGESLPTTAGAATMPRAREAERESPVSLVPLTNRCSVCSRGQRVLVHR